MYPHIKDSTAGTILGSSVMDNDANIINELTPTTVVSSIIDDKTNMLNTMLCRSNQI